MNRCSALVSLVLFAAVSLTPSVAAQVVHGEFGFVVSGNQGDAGDGCHGFDCVPHQLGVEVGESLDVLVRAPLHAPFVVFASPRAGLCAPVPGIQNSLVIDLGAIVPLFVGTADQQSFSRDCYSGYATRSLPVPPAPAGFKLYLQSLAAVGTPDQPNTGWAFSSAIQLFVRRAGSS